MICPRCKNQDENYFWKTDMGVYCRKCIHLGKVYIDKNPDVQIITTDVRATYHLDYTLTKEQKLLSTKLLENFKAGIPSYVKAVCGAGKTEIVYEVIQYALSKGMRVCFTTPRKELTKELFARLNGQFQGVTISLVYGGHSKKTSGQFVICTTHQLHRFYNCFDLLILDEMDAFPYEGDEVLKETLQSSIKGTFICMSATSNDERSLLLTKRYHGFPLPVPDVKIMPKSISILSSIQKIHNYTKKSMPTCIFVATIDNAKALSSIYKLVKIKHAIVYAGLEDIQQSLTKLKEGEVDVIICTTILERGVTIENLQVLILDGHNAIYTRETLIQIAGRVGRKSDYPTGEVIIYTVYKTKAIKECIASIQEDNV